MQNPLCPITANRYHGLFILTGAGISVASGLRPYRGPGGIWEESGVEHLATPEGLARDPHAVWKLFGPLRDILPKTEPNEAHKALARWEEAYRGDDFLLVTQNIDGLHQRAGSRRVVELHGTIARTRCSSESCILEPFEDSDSHLETLPLCELCGAPLRPDIVLFGEQIPPEASHPAKRALRNVGFFLAVGTSGTVYPAAQYVNSAEYAGARTVLVNLEPMEPRNRCFQEEYLGPAEELLPKLLVPG